MADPIADQKKISKDQNPEHSSFVSVHPFFAGPPLFPIASFHSDDHGEELFVVNVDPAALLRVVAAEGVGQRLQRHAELDEVVEGDGASMLPIELFHKEIHGGRLKPISHHAKSSRQLALVDETRIVPIVTAERLLPSSHVVPQLRELLKINGSRVIAVEHDDHLPDGFGIERRPSSIGESLSEFRRADLTRTIFVHLGKDVPQELGIGWSRHRDRGCRFEMRRKDCANDTLFLFVCLFVCLFIPCDREQNNHA